jgi:hypothetical protein
MAMAKDYDASRHVVEPAEPQEPSARRVKKRLVCACITVALTTCVARNATATQVWLYCDFTSGSVMDFASGNTHVVGPTNHSQIVVFDPKGTPVFLYDPHAQVLNKMDNWSVTPDRLAVDGLSASASGSTQGHTTGGIDRRTGEYRVVQHTEGPRPGDTGDFSWLGRCQKGKPLPVLKNQF